MNDEQIQLIVEMFTEVKNLLADCDRRLTVIEEKLDLKER